MATDNHIHVYRYENGVSVQIEKGVVREAPIALTVNNEAWLTFMCTPLNLEAMAVGFLYNEGVISSRAEVAEARVCEHGDNVDVWLTHEAEQPKHWKRTSGCTGGVTAADSRWQMAEGGGRRAEGGGQRAESGGRRVEYTPEQICRLSDMLLSSQELYRETGGVHTSALSDGEKILIAAEDIGRHNTLDKIAGRCLLENIWPEERILLTTGRISSEMLQKAARLGASVLISRTSPSSLSIEMAEAGDVTLIGYARRDRFNVYAHAERIVNK
ncbi:MAG: formate dehydrogenase accessory sulfurtransferase FdhD [Anaerolineales bacterium]|nr:formate dehydrogenase accessory sulfurtransferase FdhD [Anaerolineales bacterium]